MIWHFDESGVQRVAGIQSITEKNPGFRLNEAFGPFVVSR